MNNVCVCVCVRVRAYNTALVWRQSSSAGSAATREQNIGNKATAVTFRSAVAYFTDTRPNVK
jgi:hypothetical protein